MNNQTASLPFIPNSPKKLYSQLSFRRITLGLAWSCPSYWGVRLAEVPVKRGSTVYRKSSIRLPGGLFISSPLEGGGLGLNRDVGLTKFRKDNGFSSPWTTRIQSGKAQVQEGLRSRIQGSESKPKSRISPISPHEVLQSWLINKVYNLLISEE